MDTKTKDADVEFIRLFFPSPAEEAVAVRLARLFAAFAAPDVAALRPSTQMSEIWHWAETRCQDVVSFVVAMEDELGADLDGLADGFDHVTFRELVEYAVSHNHDSR
jgi:hypothetical protein